MVGPKNVRARAWLQLMSLGNIFALLELALGEWTPWSIFGNFKNNFQVSYPGMLDWSPLAILHWLFPVLWYFLGGILLMNCRSEVVVVDLNYRFGMFLTWGQWCACQIWSIIVFWQSHFCGFEMSITSPSFSSPLHFSKSLILMFMFAVAAEQLNISIPQFSRENDTVSGHWSSSGYPNLHFPIPRCQPWNPCLEFTTMLFPEM